MKTGNTETSKGGGGSTGNSNATNYTNGKPSTPVPSGGYISPRFRPQAETIKPSKSTTGEIKV